MIGRSMQRFGLATGLVLLAALGASACGTEQTGSSSRAGAATSGGAASGTGSAGSPVEGGTAASGGAPMVAGTSGTGGSASGGGGAGGAPTPGCDTPGLTWKTARKTYYTSYPEPGSQECIEFSGCLYEGLFSACNDKKTQAWVSEHNIVAAFPDYQTLSLHDLCLRSGDKTIVVTVLDTCGDADCGGCCTQNKGSADELIDLESYTNERWGVEDGQIEWADLGPTKTAGCD